jgi:uncharacterized protein DUF4232
MRLRRNRGGRRRTRLQRLLVLTGTLALIATGLYAPAASSARPTPRCSAAGLRLDKVGEQGFTSHREWALALRNVSPRTCRLKGYPKVALLDSGARFMRTVVTHHSGPQRNVVLRPWKRAFFTFTFATNGPCPSAVFAYGVRVIPPGASLNDVWYAGRFGLCGPAPAHVDVSPLQATRPF